MQATILLTVFIGYILSRLKLGCDYFLYFFWIYWQPPDTWKHFILRISRVSPQSLWYIGHVLLSLHISFTISTGENFGLWQVPRFHRWLCNKTRKQNLQANSRSPCQFWHKERRKHISCSREVAHTRSTPGIELKLSSFLLYHVSTCHSFWDTGWLFKFRYLGMKSAIWRKVSKLHMYSLSTPDGRN